MKISAQPVDSSIFLPYGQVLMATGDGVQREDFAARLVNERDSALPNLAFIRVRPTPLPVSVGLLERHPHSSQTFIPLQGTRYLVVVCPTGPAGDPDVERTKAFVVGGGQAINFDVRTWHAPKIVLGGPGEFVMLRWDDASDADTEVRALDSCIVVQ